MSIDVIKLGSVKGLILPYSADACGSCKWRHHHDELSLFLCSSNAITSSSSYSHSLLICSLLRTPSPMPWCCCTDTLPNISHRRVASRVSTYTKELWSRKHSWIQSRTKSNMALGDNTSFQNTSHQTDWSYNRASRHKIDQSKPGLGWANNELNGCFLTFLGLNLTYVSVGRTSRDEHRCQEW